MSDYIKREDAIKANENYVPYQRLGEDRQSYMDRILKELPGADVVEVVRCKNCRHSMSKEEIIDKWQLLLDNYQTLELLFGYDKETLNAIAPDKELIEETIWLLEEQEHE